MKKYLIPFFLFFCFHTNFSQTDSYKNTLVEFMKVQGDYETLYSTFDQMVLMMGVDSSDETYKDLKEEMIVNLIDKMVPLYKKYYSEDELREAIKLFQTPIGQKIAESKSLILNESMQLSMQWGMEISGKLQEMINR
tara:strand:+ start:177 stop:587 length:411 start_codon:yes stop_codon:yes gene_type:complete